MSCKNPGEHVIFQDLRKGDLIMIPNDVIVHKFYLDPEVKRYPAVDDSFWSIPALVLNIDYPGCRMRILWKGQINIVEFTYTDNDRIHRM